MVGLAIVAGSRNLAHFDAALVAYTFSILFATFGLTYRYAMWLERPPTALYWWRGWQVVFRRGPGTRRLRNLGRGLSEAVSDIALNRFIYALGIRHVGETNAIRLARHFLTVDALQAALMKGKPGEEELQELTNIGGIGEVVAEAIIEFFKEKKNRAAISALLERTMGVGGAVGSGLGGLLGR